MLSSNVQRGAIARVAIVAVSCAALYTTLAPTKQTLVTRTFGSSFGSPYAPAITHALVLAPMCFDNTFSSACPSDATFYGTVKGSCCMYPAVGYDTICQPNTFKSTCLNPRMGFAMPALAPTFIGSVRGNCCRRVPRAPVVATPTCFEEFRSACPVTASYHGTSVRGPCCINPAFGLHTHCVPNMFKSTCVHPDDIFIGTVRGTCCTRVPAGEV